MLLLANLSYPFVVDIPLQCCRRLWSGRSTVYIQYITYFVAESSFSSTIMDGHCLTVTIVFQDWFGIGKVEHLCEVNIRTKKENCKNPKYWMNITNISNILLLINIWSISTWILPVSLTVLNLGPSELASQVNTPEVWRDISRNVTNLSLLTALWNRNIVPISWRYVHFIVWRFKILFK